METPSRKGIGGPKTPEGKKRSSLNSLVHGLCTKSPHGLQEVEQMLGITYEQMLRDMRANYHPVGPIEEALVRRIARCYWRIRLFEVQEDQIMERRGMAHGIGGDRQRLMRTERLVDIQLHRSIEALMKLKDTERKNVRSELKEARLSRSLYAPLPHEFARPKNELAGANELPAE